MITGTFQLTTLDEVLAFRKLGVIPGNFGVEASVMCPHQFVEARNNDPVFTNTLPVEDVRVKTVQGFRELQFKTVVDGEVIWVCAGSLSWSLSLKVVQSVFRLMVTEDTLAK